MARVKPDSFRSHQSSGLRHIATLLERYGICLDTGPIQSAANQCDRSKPQGKESWGYRIENLLFRDIEKPKNCWPKSISDLTIEFSLDISGKCLPEDHAQDPFLTLAMDIVVRGRTSSGIRGVCAWHLDRHIGKHNGRNGGAAHPHYHFQYGGDRLLGEISDSGDALIIEAPRIAHPPLEATLGIDFILSNFKSQEWARISQDHQYQNIVKQAQKHCWRSYAYCLSMAFPPKSEVQNTDNKLVPKELWPQLM